MPNSSKKCPSELSIQQLNAIDALVSGIGVAKTAEMLSLNRHTITRWRQSNPFFIAKLNDARKERWAEAHERLRGMVDKALDVMEASIEAGDSRVAVEVLKAVNIYGSVPSPKGSTSSDAVMLELAQKRARELLYDDPISSDPQSVTYTAKMMPIITTEIYQDMKDNIEDYVGEDDDETTSIESATGIER